MRQVGNTPLRKERLKRRFTGDARNEAQSWRRKAVILSGSIVNFGFIFNASSISSTIN